jgi:pimeloyl-ACP methyl ester carboxylesterase/DNA-binding winged helix-turn-helix (wHTH) protein
VHSLYRFGPYELDVRRRELRRQGTAVHLGSRALDLLCELVGAEGALVTKDTLMARVWPDVVVEENNLQVQVSALRRLFAGEEQGRRWLQTVPGRGYRFVAAVPADGAPMDPPAQSVRFVRAGDGVRLAAAATGDGPPLVRAGVWMTHLEHDWSTQLWGPLHARLGAQFRLVRYDQRGTGLSDREVERLDFESMVSDLEAVVDDFGLDSFCLVGISQGVAAAVEYAVRHPERVRALILVGGYARGWRRRGDPAIVERGEALRTLTRIGWGQDNPAFRQLFTSLAMPNASREQMDAFNELQRLSATPEMAARFLDLVGDVDVTARLPLVRPPTLVMHSRDDAWVPCELGRTVAAGIPGAQFVSLASSSHVVMPSEPGWEAFVNQVLAFAHARCG